MKTITFYSYKGGVGRTLTLANIAKRLSEFGKSVCIIDFDLEAPGVPYKFKRELSGLEYNNGLVDYLYHYIQFRSAPAKIDDYLLKMNSSMKMKGDIHLMPAGDIKQTRYWKRLARINWDKFFFEADSKGVSFFLDLKEKIRKSINPDYLLIDSRTGITEIAGISMNLLADKVVLLTVNNEESLDGTKQVLKTLLSSKNPVTEEQPEVHLVLTRVPKYVGEDKKTYPTTAVVSKVQRNIDAFCHENNFEFDSKLLKIHSDPILLLNEQLVMMAYEEENVSDQDVIAVDYLKLFKRIIKLEAEEEELLKRTKAYEHLKQEVLVTKNIVAREKILNKAKNKFLDLDKVFILYNLGLIEFQYKNYPKAVTYFEKVAEADKMNKENNTHLIASYLGNGEEEVALNLYNQFKAQNRPLKESLEGHIFVSIARFFFRKGNNKKAEEFYNKAIQKYSENVFVNNEYAMYLIYLNRFEEALDYAYKSLELAPRVPFAIATLAEIYGSMGNNREFYRNITLALDSGLKAEEIDFNLPVYQKYLQEEKFQELLERYGIEIEE